MKIYLFVAKVWRILMFFIFLTRIPLYGQSNLFQVKFRDNLLTRKLQLKDSLFKLDTIHNTKDSLVILYLSKAGRVLKMEQTYFSKQTIFKGESLGDLTDTTNKQRDTLLVFDTLVREKKARSYYNSKNLIDYYERYYFLSTWYDVPKYGQYMSVIRITPDDEPQDIERFEYDDRNNLILRVSTLGEGNRFRYKYDSVGKFIDIESEIISPDQFWEN